jgi:hypothetical protein
MNPHVLRVITNGDHVIQDEVSFLRELRELQAIIGTLL